MYQRLRVTTPEGTEHVHPTSLQNGRISWRLDEDGQLVVFGVHRGREPEETIHGTYPKGSQPRWE